MLFFRQNLADSIVLTRTGNNSVSQLFSIRVRPEFFLGAIQCFQQVKTTGCNNRLKQQVERTGWKQQVEATGWKQQVGTTGWNNRLKQQVGTTG